MKMFLLLTMIIVYSNGCAQCDSSWIYKSTEYRDLPIQVTAPNNSTGWKLDQNNSDEFNEDILNPARWNLLPQGVCPSSSDFAYYKAENSNVKNGKLILTCQPDNPYICGTDTLYYSTGWVGMYPAVHYGYIEIQTTMPANPAQAPCFWMFGEIPEKYDEIDVYECIIEHPLFDNRLRHNIYHMESQWPYSDTIKSGQLIEGNFYQSFKTKPIIFAVEWLPYEINYYINGEVSACAKFTTDMRLMSPYDLHPPSEFCCIPFANAIPQWIMLSLALRKSTDSLTPDTIEYIRTYKLQQGIQGLYWPDYINIHDPNLSKVHKDIKIGGDSIHLGLFPHQSQINLWANNSIIFEKGFEIDVETRFTARTVITDPACFMPDTQPIIINQ